MSTPWPAVVTNYRALLQTFSIDVKKITHTARELRSYMADHDPDYPLYHLAAPEGWVNDPNGITFDERTGLYHRFFQYDKTYDEGCSHKAASTCGNYSFSGASINARVWGHTVSSDLIRWQDWPGINADSQYDAVAVWSGNCAFMDDGKPVCIYSGGRHTPCDTGVCAYTDDWINWKKTGCMRHAPSAASQTNHDTSIFRVGKQWHILTAGCTFNGTNNPNAGVKCAGNAQLWTSADLRSIEYAHPLTPGGPNHYWELPYLLPFDAHGLPLPNDKVADAAITALLFSNGSNAYWIGNYDTALGRFTPSAKGAKEFAPSGVWANSSRYPKGEAGRPAGWPWPGLADTIPPYYSFNPHATDDKGMLGVGGGTKSSTRRLMFGFVYGKESAASSAGDVPYWQCGHSLLRLITLRGNHSLVQAVAPEVHGLRVAASHVRHDNVSVQPARPSARGSFELPGIYGDSLEVMATFAVDQRRTNATTFGLRLRVLPTSNRTSTSADIDHASSAGGTAGHAASSSADETAFSCDVGWTPSNTSSGQLSVGEIPSWHAAIVPQPQPDVVQLHVFLDRSIIEVYTGGAALTQRCLLPPSLWAKAKTTGRMPAETARVEAFAVGGGATLVRVESWRMGSMWGS